MPQDIPLEASETLVFTPPALGSGDSPPRFVLRAATTREKRFRARILTEEGVTFHGDDALRAETLAGLKAHWSAEDYAAHSPRITAYWQAREEFALQLRDDPELEWTYDEAEERLVEDVLDGIARLHRPLGRMRADNREFNEMLAAASVAVAVESWSGLDAKPERDRGYLTLECVDRLARALERAEQAAGVTTPGLAWAELCLACFKRMKLDEDEEKNSASPSPSKAPRPSSRNGRAAAADGTSPASDTSTKTREDA